MFLVPEEYQDNKPLEFMLKELSFLFCKLAYYYANSNQFEMKLKNIKIEIERKKINKWNSYQIKLPTEIFLLTCCASSDGLIFKDCAAYLDGNQCSENDIELLVKKTLIFMFFNKKLTILL